MTRDAAREKIALIMLESFDTESFYAEGWDGDLRLAEDLGLTSLDTVTLSIEIESVFGIKFSGSPSERGPVDLAWDDVKTMDDVIGFVLRFV